METPLIVTAIDPVEVNVSDCVAVVFTVTVPNAMFVEFTLNFALAVAEFSCSVRFCEEPPEFADIVAVCVVVTAETVAANAAFVAPAGTITEDGTETALLLLARLTAWPEPLAAEDKVTVQLSVAYPVMGFIAQFRLLTLAFFPR